MSAPLRFPPALIAAIHMVDKRDIAAEMAAWSLGGGVLPYHGIRTDGTCTCGNPDCPDAGKHPDLILVPRGALDATTDLRRAMMWFETHPEHNVGFCLGPSLAALDFDPRKGADLGDNCGLPLRTMTAQTGGGGMHRLYRHTGRQKLRGGHIAQGIEFRTGNQAIVVEKSQHRSGRAYEWRDLEAPIAPLPHGVAARFQRDHYADPSSSTAAYFYNPASFGTEPHVVEANRIRQDLLRGKHRTEARLLLEGKWEQVGYTSQSEAEYNLVLMISAWTSDPVVWHVLLMTSGLAKRDRECARRDDGHGNKLVRPCYIDSLFAAVARRRAELQTVGDPNLDLAQRVFSSIDPCQGPPRQRRLVHPLPGDVLDAKELNRRGPKTAPKRSRAKIALVTFLAHEEVVVDRNGFVRVPMVEAAKAMQTNRETLRQAVNELVEQQLAETLEPGGYRKKGGFAKDRYLRLAMSCEEAMSRLGVVIR